MEWTIYGETHLNLPTKEGWYLTLFKAYSTDEIFPLPLYFQFAWNIPKDFDDIIEYYTEIGNPPVELVGGRIF